MSEVESVTRFLKEKSSFFLSKGNSISYWGPTYGATHHNNIATELLSPIEEGADPSYHIVSLYDDCDGLGFELFRLVKAKIKSRPKIIYVISDSHLDEPYSCTLNGLTNYHEPEDESQHFGLLHDGGYFGEGGYFTQQVSFIGGSLGPTIFKSLGIKRRPRSDHIDIYMKTGDEYALNKSTVFIREGDTIVKIDGKKIISKIPVYIHGTSSDWKLVNGGVNNEEAPDHPLNDNENRPRENWGVISGGGISERELNGSTIQRTDFTKIYFDGEY
jgi:hypothetical protein